jgi:hypothetical protein
MSMCNEIYSKHIHCDCIFGRSRQETETHINEMSACHVSLFQDSHLHHSCRGISSSDFIHDPAKMLLWISKQKTSTSSSLVEKDKKFKSMTDVSCKSFLVK